MLNYNDLIDVTYIYRTDFVKNAWLSKNNKLYVDINYLLTLEVNNIKFCKICLDKTKHIIAIKFYKERPSLGDHIDIKYSWKKYITINLFPIMKYLNINQTRDKIHLKTEFIDDMLIFSYKDLINNKIGNF